MMPAVFGDARQTGERRAYIVVVDDDVVDLELLDVEIAGRYGGAYGVVSESSAGKTLTALEAMQRNGKRVAVVLAGQWISPSTARTCYPASRPPHPRAKRVLLISPGDWGHERTADAIRGAIASGCVDHYLPSRRRPLTNRSIAESVDSCTSGRPPRRGRPTR